MIRTGAVAAAAAVAGGVGASVLVAGVGAAEGGGCSTQPSTERVVVQCTGTGGDVTLPGGVDVTVELAGASGGAVATVAGGHGALLQSTLGFEQDTVVGVTLGAEGSPGTTSVEGPGSGGGGGGASWISLGAPAEAARAAAPGETWLLIAGGGGGRGTQPEGGAGGPGGTPDGGNALGADGATGGTLLAPGSGAKAGGTSGDGSAGGAGVAGGGSGGSGYFGGGGGGQDGGGGGGGSSNTRLGTAVLYAVADAPGDGWARFSWNTAGNLDTVPPSTSAPSPTIPAGQATSDRPPPSSYPAGLQQPTTEAQQDDPELVPVADESVVVAPVSGTVLIRRSDGTVTELKAGEVIPVGAIVDARDGVVRLTAAREANGLTQTALFWNAVFEVTQQADRGARAAATSSAKLLTELTLKQQPTGCAGRARAAARKGGGLWGDGKGRFRVRGNSSSATVRGTKWYVENRCDGTYTRVVRGVVAVEDFAKRKTIILRAGGAYTAQRPAHRKRRAG